jgi:chromosome segregation ATPase
MSRSLNPQLFGINEVPVVKIEGAMVQQRKLSEIDSQIEALTQKLDRWAQIMEQKIQQLHSAQKSNVEQMKQLADSFSGQNAAIHSKLNERRGIDAKTQEMIERHNQLVNSFETRIQHVQKVSTEQEIKLMTYQSTYDEVLREIRALRMR